MFDGKEAFAISQSSIKNKPLQMVLKLQIKVKAANFLVAVKNK